MQPREIPYGWQKQPWEDKIRATPKRLNPFGLRVHRASNQKQACPVCQGKKIAYIDGELQFCKTCN